MRVNLRVMLHDTDLFKGWMKGKGYVWPENPISQENMVGEFIREGIEMARKEEATNR